MVESAIRSRARAAHQPGNPFVFWGVLAGCLGLVLVGLAGYFFKNRTEESERAGKWKRGVEILNRLTPIACDYFYTGRKGHLPEEVWAPFRACEKDGDFFDAMIVRKDIAGRNEVIDAARYKEGKSADGQTMGWSDLTNSMYHGRPGPPPEPDRARIEIFEGKVRIGEGSKDMVFFRRPILRSEDKTDVMYGQAVVILYKNVQGPTGVPAAVTAEPKPAAAEPKKNAPAAKP